MIKVLSIDGGGIRGIIPATVLAEIEKKTGKLSSELFDIIAGTSTGGILSLGLTVPGNNGKAKYKAKELIDLYRKNGRKIFDRSFWKGLSSVAGITDEKYDHKPLVKVLKTYLGQRLLKSAVQRTLISTYDIYGRTPIFFKSWRKDYNNYEMWKVARATSAGPTYFEPQLLTVTGKDRVLVDGGVFINNPAVSAYAEAIRLSAEGELPDEQILVVSMGTGELTRPITYDEAKDWGKLEWALPILSVVFDGVSDGADYQLKQILGEEFYYRFQTVLDNVNDDLDDASQGNIDNLIMKANKLVEDKAETIDKVCDLLTG